LKRCYIDRILDTNNLVENDKLFYCPNCNELIGMQIIYEKEKRPAIRFFVAAVNYIIVPLSLPKRNVRLRA